MSSALYHELAGQAPTLFPSPQRYRYAAGKIVPQLRFPGPASGPSSSAACAGSLQVKTIAKTICNRDCPDACSIVATIEEGRITHLAGTPDHPVTQGFLCYRTSHFLETQYSSQRLTKPLLRSSASGKLLPVSWEEALSYTADKLLQIRKESGPASIFYYRSVARWNDGRGRRPLLGTFWAGDSQAWRHLFGGGRCRADRRLWHRRIERFFRSAKREEHPLWGKSFISSPHLLPLLKDCRRAGAQLALIDPVATSQQVPVRTLCRSGRAGTLRSRWRSDRFCLRKLDRSTGRFLLRQDPRISRPCAQPLA